MHPRLQEAAAHLKAGRDREAAALCEEALAADGMDTAALQLLGVALTRLGRVADAVPLLERGTALAPGSAALHRALGNALHRAGEHERARRSYESALACDPDDAASRFQLAVACEALGDLAAAREGFGAVARANPLDYDAVQRYVGCIAGEARLEASCGAPPPDESPAAFATVTVGFCTVDDGRAAVARESLARALAPAACDFHVVRDARSLAEAFNRILEAARGDAVILCHDDIEVWTPRLDLALARAFREADLVGVAGAERVTGPAVLWAGHPHVHGGVVYPRGEGAWEAAPLSLRGGVIGGMQALDGVFMALSAKAARVLRFDERTFDGFHFYDLDFSYRAFLDGWRVAVTTEPCLVHASEGRFDASWKRYADRFSAKHPRLSSPAGAPHWYGARFDSREAVLSFHQRLRHAAPGA